MSTTRPAREEIELPGGARLELLLRLCALISVVGAIGLLWMLAGRLGIVPSPGPVVRFILVVCVSAGVGFTTNWLAIKMLFRPRRRVPWMVLWTQGLLPREQPRLAKALGNVAAEHLLGPDAITRALGDARLRASLGGALRNELETFLEAEQTRRVLQRTLAEGFRQHGPQVVHRLRPELRRAIESLLDRHLTAERLLGWMEAGARHVARNREARRSVARWIFHETAREGVVTRIVDLLKEQMYAYRQRHPIRGFLAEQFVVDWDDLRESIVDTLRSQAASEDLAEVLVETAHSIADQLRQPAATERVARVRGHLVDLLLDWFERDGVAMLADRVAILAEEPATWELLGGAMDELGTRLPEALFEPDGDLRPHVRGQLETLQERLLAAFPIADIVEGQVLAMDPEAIERLVDDVGRRELGWIQVLGLILGALAGIVLAVGL